MAAGRADDVGVPSGQSPDGSVTGGVAGRAAAGRAARAETRSREEYYVSLRHKVTAGQRSAAAEEQARAENWAETAELSRWMWTEYRRRWPPEEHADDTPPRDGADDDRGDAECERVAERERERISPALRDIESQDPSRHLTGFEHPIKGRDRIKEKVSVNINDFDHSPEEAVSLVPDTVRYTFSIHRSRYRPAFRAAVPHPHQLRGEAAYPQRL